MRASPIACRIPARVVDVALQQSIPGVAELVRVPERGEEHEDSREESDHGHRSMPAA